MGMTFLMELELFDEDSFRAVLGDELNKAVSDGTISIYPTERVGAVRVGPPTLGGIINIIWLMLYYPGGGGRC